ncbi:uncharacterized protein LOC136766284 isoform X2 [Amia ocellicauda]
MATQGDLVVVDTETETTQQSSTNEQDLTPAPADTYLPSQSQAPEILNSHGESNVMGGEISEESNDFNEIITPKDELLNKDSDGKVIPTLENVVEVIPATLSSLLSKEEGNSNNLFQKTNDSTEIVTLGLEAWKIGAISAAAFLFLETIVIVVYCLKCRKRRIRMTLPVKMSEDSEAAETIHEESNENTLTGGDVRVNQISSNGSWEPSQNEEKKTKDNSLQDMPKDVKTSVL